MKRLGILGFLGLCFLFLALGSTDVPKEVEQGKKPASAAKVMLTQAALDKLAEITEEIANKYMKEVRVAKIGRYYDEGGFEISDIHILEFRKPKKYTMTFNPEKDGLQLDIVDFDFISEGQVEGNYNKIKAYGPAKITAKKVDVVVVTEVLRSKKQTLEFNPYYCRTKIDSFDLDGKQLKGNGASIMRSKKYKPMVDEMAQNALEVDLCRHLRGILKEILSKALTNDQPVNPLVVSKNQKNKVFSRLDLSKYKVDYKHVERPKVKKSHLEIYPLGEISYQGRGKTPFNAPDKGFEDHSSYMMYIKLLPHLFNSLFYHLHDQKQLTIQMDPDTASSIKDFLQTTCSNDKCIGAMLGKKVKKYKNHDVEIEIEPKMPYVKVDGNKMMLKIIGDLSVFAVRPSKSSSKRRYVVDSGTIDATLSMDFDVKDELLYGKVKTDKIELKIKSDKADDIADGMKKGFADAINDELLAAGIPLPALTSLAIMKNAKVDIEEESAMVRTDLDVDKAAVTKYADKIFANPLVAG